MKSYFYLQTGQAEPIRLGPFDLADSAEARRAALDQLGRYPEARAIDVWSEPGELYRVERPARPAATSAGAAWANAFRRPPPANPKT